MSSRVGVRDMISSLFHHKTPSLVLAFGITALTGLSRPAIALGQDESPNSRLIPAVTAAADTRLRRKRAGKWMMVGGFSLYAVGGGAAVYGLLHHLGRQQIWCEGEDSCPTKPMNAQDEALTIGGLVAAGIGLALAIPGIVMVARQTDVETEAVNRYLYPNVLYESPYTPEASRWLPSTKSINLSLLAFSF
jgi:hypothetical protein